jgi:hypothetical protein
LLGLKDYSELDEYNYKVCEISSCEEEATELFTDEETRIIDVCYKHSIQLENNRYIW